MFKLTCKVSLEGPNGERIRLKIRRGSGFWINECFYYNYRWDENCISLDVDSFVYDGDLSDLDHVYRRAISNFERSNKLLSFLFGIKLIIEYQNIYRRNIKKVNNIQETPLISSENINRIHCFMGALNNIVKSENKNQKEKEISLRKKYYAAIDYFNRSLDALDIELYEDALLNQYRGLEILGREGYKAIESQIITNFKNIFSDFLRKTVDEEYGEHHRQLFDEFKPLISKKLMTDTRKILKELKELKGFNTEELANAKKICDVRNSLSHGNTEVNEIEFDLLASGQLILRKMIALMLLKKNYFKAYPFADIKYYNVNCGN
ncbi:HEPN domain-containing protein [Ectobacillus sp. sgz5001026]|uniref:HEPN domain-containing protein n=1 Tax=Ectobacillus sp. sgz5001026 TaxID=3242473 RepID=UPI0036D3F8BD